MRATACPAPRHHHGPGADRGYEVATAGDGNSKLTIEDQVVLLQLLDEQPDATLEELVERMAKRQKVRVSISTLSRRLIELGLTRKKRLSMPAKPTGPRSRKNASGSCAEASSDGPDDCFSSTRPASTCR